MSHRTDLRRFAILPLLLAAGVVQAQAMEVPGAPPASPNVLAPAAAPVAEPASAPPAIPAGTEALIEPANMGPKPLPVPPAQDALDATLRELAGLQTQIAHAATRYQLLTQEAAISALQTQMGSRNTGTGDVPELVGISGTRERLVAEFLSNGSLMSVRAGDWVTPEWKLLRVMVNGVEMSKKGSNKVHAVMFGHLPATAGPALTPLAPSSSGLMAPPVVGLSAPAGDSATFRVGERRP